MRRRGEVKWTSNEGRRVLISRESDEWDDARRLARNERAKPNGVAICPEAGKGAPFTRTKIIINNNILNNSIVLLYICNEKS